MWADNVAYTGLGVHENLVNMRCIHIFLPTIIVVSEPDSRKIEKEAGLAHRLGWKCTLHAPGMKVHFRLAFD